MAKKIKVCVEQGLKIGGKYPPVGSEISVDEKEVGRLLELGAVSLPRAQVAKASPTPEEAELLAQIQAAQTEEELLALVPGDEQRPSVVEAASLRLEALAPGQA